MARTRRLHLDLPILDRLDVLEVDIRLDDAAVEELFASAAARRVRVLSLRGALAVAAPPEALLRAELASEQLDLSFNRLGAEGAAALARARCLSQVKRLALAAANLGDAGVRALWRAPLERLRYLDLSSNELLEPETLNAALSLPALATLELAANRFTCHARLRARAAALSRLNLSLNAVDDAGAGALARCDGLADLATLELWGNPCGGAGAALLRSRFGGRVRL
jgi:hypothetical protein